MQAVVIKLYNDKKTENACTVENTFKTTSSASSRE